MRAEASAREQPVMEDEGLERDDDGETDHGGAPVRALDVHVEIQLFVRQEPTDPGLPP